MKETRHLLTLDEPAIYHIQVVGRLDKDWSANFGGMAITSDVFTESLTITHLIGKVPDQAGLHGLLCRIRDLGLPLLKVEFIANSSLDGASEIQTI